MKKRLNYYNIFMTAMFVVIAGLLLASGIVAIQKSMKLNLAVKMNPSITCKINASFDGGESYKEVFSNAEGDTAIGANWLISGNTLTYDNTAEGSMGMTVKLKVQNLTPNTKVMIESLDQVKDVVATNATSSAFDVAIPAGGKVAIDFSQVFAITKGEVKNATITPKSNVYTIDNTYYVKQNEEASFTLTGSGNYDTPAQGAIGLPSGLIKSYSNGTLTLNTLTSDTTITINNTTVKTYTVTKGTLTGFAWGTVAGNAQFNTDYTFTLVLQDGYKIDGATVQAVIGGNTYDCSQTAASGTTYTFKLAGASITGNVTINAAAEEALPYTIGTYGVDVILGTDTIVTETGYNGYKYVEFNEVKSWTNDKGYSVPLRWVIIGAGANQKDLLPSGAANKSANPDNLGVDEILVISEQTIEWNMYDGSYANWSSSNIRTRLKSYTESGGFMAEFKEYMVPKALTTVWYSGGVTTNATTAGDPDYMFLLAYNDTSNATYATQDFLIENYLGSEGSDLYKARYVGYSNNPDYWWLRSGYCKLNNYAYLVSNYGYYDYVKVDINAYAVRPSFILNLA